MSKHARRERRGVQQQEQHQPPPPLAPPWCGGRQWYRQRQRRGTSLKRHLDTSTVSIPAAAKRTLHRVATPTRGAQRSCQPSPTRVPHGPACSRAMAPQHVAQQRSQLRGDVLVPGDPAFDAAVSVWARSPYLADPVPSPALVVQPRGENVGGGWREGGGGRRL
jgi:hypothetical protein